MGCMNYERNLEICNCSYEGCSRKGFCCDCLQYHLAKDCLPACCFPPEAEKTFDRSIKHFIEVYQQTKK